MTTGGFQKEDEEENNNIDVVIGIGRRQSMKPPLNKSKSILNNTGNLKPFSKMDEILSIFT
jgi:hypothetical protein